METEMKDLHEKRESEKQLQPWTTPQVVRYGNVEELTLGALGFRQTDASSIGEP